MNYDIISKTVYDWWFLEHLSFYHHAVIILLVLTLTLVNYPKNSTTFSYYSDTDLAIILALRSGKIISLFCFFKAWDLHLDLFSVSLGVCRWCSQSKAKNYLTVTAPRSCFFLKVKENHMLQSCLIFRQFIKEAGRTPGQTASGHYLTLKK